MLSIHARLFAILLLLAAAIPVRAAETAWPVPDWQTAKPESEGMSAAGIDKVRDWLKEHGSKTGLVVRHGRVVGEWYFDDAKVESKYLVYSTTKSFASTAAGLVISDGKLALDTKIGDVLTGLEPAEKKNVTVGQIISMTTGVHNEPTITTKPDLFTYALTKAPMDFKPGEKWDYNNTGLALLTPVLKQVTGKSLDQILSERVFQPIGISAGDWTWDVREGQPLSYSGLHITGRALARFGLLALRGGKWQERQVLPEGWIAKASAPSQDLNKSYGYLWWNNTTGKWPGVPSDAYAALGRFDNSMLIVPSLDLVVIRQVGDDTAGNHKLNIGELWKLAVDAVEGKK